jgi:ribose transport system substrate-binding protein
MEMHWFPSRRLLALCVMAVLAISVAACGSDDKDSSSAAASGSTSTAAAAPSSADSALADLQKTVDAHKAIASIGPTTPLTKAPPKGVKVIYVNCGQPACTEQYNAAKVAAADLGWSLQQIQSQPTPEKVQAAFTEAIRRGPDAVISAGFSAALYPRQIAEMKAKKISVLSITGGDETDQNGITYEPLGPKGASEANRVLADKTIVDIGGKGEVGSVMLGGYPIVKTYTEAYEGEIKTKCPDCTVKRIELQPTSIGKDAPQIISNFMRANPNLKSIYYSYDILGAGVPAAAKGAGLTKLPFSYGWAPSKQGFQDLASGERKAALIMPFPELAWMTMDAEARLKTGGSVEGSTPTQPIQIVSKDFNNVPSASGPYPASVKDYQAQFKKLWLIQ